MKQHSPSFARNKDAILAVLREVLPGRGTVLEIGSGTGEHAAYFAAHLPQLQWQPTDLPSNHASIRAWAQAAALPNLSPPLLLDLRIRDWPLAQCDAIVCINTIHIVAWEAVENLFAGAGRTLTGGGIFYAYGAYRYADRPLEPSNEEFDRWLKQRDPASGVREFESVAALARRAGLELFADRPMPANNRSLCWRKPH